MRHDTIESHYILPIYFKFFFYCVNFVLSFNIIIKHIILVNMTVDISLSLYDKVLVPDSITNIDALPVTNLRL